MKATLPDGSFKYYKPGETLGGQPMLAIEFCAEDFEHPYIFEWIKEVAFLRLLPKRLLEDGTSTPVCPE